MTQVNSNGGSAFVIFDWRGILNSSWKSGVNVVNQGVITKIGISVDI